MKGALTGLANDLIDTFFGPFKGPGGQAKFEAFLHNITSAIKTVDAVVKFVKPAIQWLIGKLSEPDKGGGGGLKIVQDLQKVMDFVLKMMGLDFGQLGQLFKIFDNYEFDPSVITGPIMNAIDAVSEFGSKMLAAGGELMNGLVDGIENGASAVYNAVVGAVSSAIDAAKGVLGIHSPSTVFAGIGDYTTAEGFAQGMDQSDAPTRAADRMARAPIAAATQAAGAPSITNGRGGDSKTVNVEVGDVHIDAKGSDAQELARNSRRSTAQRRTRGVGAGARARDMDSGHCHHQRRWQRHPHAQRRDEYRRVALRPLVRHARVAAIRNRGALRPADAREHDAPARRGHVHADVWRDRGGLVALARRDLSPPHRRRGRFPCDRRNRGRGSRRRRHHRRRSRHRRRPRSRQQNDREGPRGHRRDHLLDDDCVRQPDGR